VLGLGAVAVAAVVTLGGDGQPAPAEPSAVELLEPGELAGQRLIAGWKGAAPPAGLRRLIAAGGLAGVVLFEDNARSRGRARRTIGRLQSIRRPPGLEEPLLVMVDQEGGAVRRLPGPPIPSAAEMGARGREYARRRGRATARSLARVGINVDLAPVLDVARPGSAIEREGRAFGGRPVRVVDTGVDGFALGLAAGGPVAATAKHFPGLGAAASNTDLAAQRIPLSAEQLRRGDQKPFAAFAEAGGEIVMLSLATYPALADRPAALSRRVIEGELRGRIGFDGVTTTDALDAAAAAAFGPWPRVALAAVGAGNDLLLYPDWRAARATGDLLSGRLQSGQLQRRPFELAAERVLELRRRLSATG
jgi:beta-N-acetylhexosaminidase